MWHVSLIPIYDLIGAIGFLLAAAYGMRNLRVSTIQRPFWFAFVATALLGALWLSLVSLEWFAISSPLMDEFSTSLQAVVIGLFAIGVIGTHVIVRDLGYAQHEVDKRAALVGVLSRVLRHNIRNDITVIRGYLQADGGDAVVKQKIDDLISTSEKARKLERTLEPDQQLTSVELGRLVREVVEEIERSYPSVTIELSGETGCTETVPPSVQLVVSELIENAVEHGGSHPTVKVTISTRPETIAITIADDGPGLPPHEQQLLGVGEETDLLHGSGIGLWIARWIVGYNGGHLDSNVTGSGTTLTIVLPREIPIEHWSPSWAPARPSR